MLPTRIERLPTAALQKSLEKGSLETHRYVSEIMIGKTEQISTGASLIQQFSVLLKAQSLDAIHSMWHRNKTLQAAVKSLDFYPAKRLLNLVLFSDPLGKSKFLTKYINSLNDANLIHEELEHIETCYGENKPNNILHKMNLLQKRLKIISRNNTYYSNQPLTEIIPVTINSHDKKVQTFHEIPPITMITPCQYSNIKIGNITAEEQLREKRKNISTADIEPNNAKRKKEEIENSSSSIFALNSNAYQKSMPLTMFGSSTENDPNPSLFVSDQVLAHSELYLDDAFPDLDSNAFRIEW